MEIHNHAIKYIALGSLYTHISFIGSGLNNINDVIRQLVAEMLNKPRTTNCIIMKNIENVLSQYHFYIAFAIGLTGCNSTIG